MVDQVEEALPRATLVTSLLSWGHRSSLPLMLIFNLMGGCTIPFSAQRLYPRPVPWLLYLTLPLIMPSIVRRWRRRVQCSSSLMPLLAQLTTNIIPMLLHCYLQVLPDHRAMHQPKPKFRPRLKPIKQQ